MIKNQHFYGAKKALLLSMAATGLLSLANTASATAVCTLFDPWVDGASYATGKTVTYNKIDYQALTSHTAYVGANWNPAASPTLWKNLGTCSSWNVSHPPTPIPTTPPPSSSYITVHESQVSRYGPCDNIPNQSQTPIWLAGKTYQAGEQVRPSNAIFHSGWTRFTAKATHISSNQNIPLDGQPNLSYDPALWSVEFVVPGVCPTRSPTATPTPPSTPTPTATATATPTATPVSSVGTWNSTAVYTAGQRVTYNGRTFEAKWWVQGQAPSTADQWGPWRDLGVINLTTATPSPTPTPTTPPCSSGPQGTTPPALPGYVWEWVVTIDGACHRGEWKSKLAPTPSPTATASPSATPSPTPANTNYVTSMKTTTWKNGAKGAYSLVHDDYCSMPVGTDPYIKIMDPELKNRGLVAGFAVITGNCSPQHWVAAKQMIANGHEIISHSRNHPDPYINDAELEAQLNGSAADIAANLDGYKASYFVWPSDTASSTGTNFLKYSSQYLGGRASHLLNNGSVDYTTMPAGINPPDFINAYRIKWDLFTVDGKWSLYPMGSEILNLHIDAAINQGGWATRTMHSVDTGYWETAPLARYQAHLDYAKAKVDAGDLWMDTPSNVIKYRFAREFCISVLDNDGPHSAVLFKNWAPECKQYATPVTLEFTAQAVTAEQMLITQDEKALTPTAKGNNTYLVTVNPLGGMVKFKQQP